MRQIPGSIPIKGIRWRVLRVGEKHAKLKGNYGAFYPDNLTIYILKTLPAEMQWAVLLHEILHAIACGYDELDLTEEWGVEATSGELMSVLSSMGVLK